MQELLARAVQHQKGRRLTAVAFTFLGLLFAINNYAAAAIGTSMDQITTGSVPSKAENYELRISDAPVGRESIELAARLKADGGLIRRPVKWRIREKPAGLIATGPYLLDENTPTATAHLMPGVYEIEITYDLARMTHVVNIPDGKNIGLTFILNVGAVRPLTISAKAATHAIYTSDGDRLIRDNIAQGEIVRLSSGNYRIESRISGSNSTAFTNVQIKPGILTSLELEHQAGIAEFVSLTSSRISKWQIRANSSDWQITGTGMPGKHLLKPGSYIFSAIINNRQIIKKLQLRSGALTKVVLGD